MIIAIVYTIIKYDFVVTLSVARGMRAFSQTAGYGQQEAECGRRKNGETEAVNDEQDAAMKP